MLNTKTLICETDANHFDRCILNTGILEEEVVVVGRLAGWVRCEQINGKFGDWFLMFIYPLYEIKKLKNEFRKHFAPTDIHFMCLCMHGHAAVDEMLHHYAVISIDGKEKALPVSNVIYQGKKNFVWEFVKNQKRILR
ncbi:uncharacterized protein LOC107274373 isoform X4 [Cephus cinctus]|uniref:Uncharacterized protein LOC107274373 isoform X4 n=1 Tax=Cephus cinctus TaxID=211228 RepID=A0AAJ7CG44_CEPCN|nr:uncharacterized protein LOC107274373 isoform X4 [Cephus cinctus]